MSRRDRRLLRLLALDVPLGLAIAFLALGVAHAQFQTADSGPFPPAWHAGPGTPDQPPKFRTDAEPLPIAAYAAIWVVVAAVMVRRIRPRAAFVASVAAMTVFLLIGGFFGPVLLGPIVLTYTMASLYQPRAWAPWTAVALPMFLVGYLDRPYFGVYDLDLYLGLGVGAALFSVPAALGVIVRSRREAARHERDEELRRFAYEERLRIAREVHDVVGHSLSVINMQAGVALHVLHKRPDRIEPSLEAIRQTSKDALEELRGTLAVFRDPEGRSDRPREPLPGLDRLDDLVSGVASAGRTAEARTEGEPGPLPAAVDHAAYRIVQEALTNVVRHAGGAGAAVLVTYRPAEVVVEITDDGPARPGQVPAEGNGIAGMRERARAVGGSLTAGPRPGGGFAVRAELPRGER
ncbi:sensor histidine kinase [Nocardiopsis mangrovi]|uniref:histidine kinase n=1 Tax=Nocardiopsis mangrovi TaxID=1179818 RepID=A0ABV9DQQ4_9ACTN